MKALGEVGKYLYSGDDPTRLLFEGKPMSIERQDGSYLLTLQLPFITKGEVSLMRSGDELVVTIGNQRHSILLPQVILGRELKGAKLDTGRLYIRFESDKGTAAVSRSRRKTSAKAGRAG